MTKNKINFYFLNDTGCKWTRGDGISQGELSLNGNFENKWDCYRACVKKKSSHYNHQRNKSINGATYHTRNKKCFCEKAMRSIDKSDRKYITCRFAPVVKYKKDN